MTRYFNTTVLNGLCIAECVKFLQMQGKSIGLPSTVYYMAPKKPVVIISLLGQKPELQSILLTSHMDVVPVCPVSLQTCNLICF